MATSGLTFTKAGYQNWANTLDANKGLSKHEHSVLPKICCAKWNDVKKLKAAKQKDLSRINPDGDEIAGRNRACHSSLFKHVIWFTTNEPPMRGSDETDEPRTLENGSALSKYNLRPTLRFLNFT